MLQVTNLVVDHGKLRALWDVSLRVGKGERRHSDQRERAGLGRDNRETRSTKCFLRRSLTVRCDRRKSVPKTVIPTRWSNKTA